MDFLIVNIFELPILADMNRANVSNDIPSEDFDLKGEPSEP